MGQAASQPEAAAGSRSRRTSSIFASSSRRAQATSSESEQLVAGRRSRAGSVAGNRLSQLFRPTNLETTLPSRADDPPRPNLLRRTRSTLREMLHPETRGWAGGLLSSSHRASSSGQDSYSDAAQYSRDVAEPGEHHTPRLPSIDLTSTFEHDTFSMTEQPSDVPPRSSHSLRRRVRLNALRADRSLRSLASQLRRRHSPHSSTAIRRTGANAREDQAALLSRLLSIAAAATAATLMGDDPQAFMEARSLTSGTNTAELGLGEEDGSFDGFLRALQNGRIASALRQSNESDEATREGPINFFRMFRFGATTSMNGNATGMNTAGQANEFGEEPTGGSTVPVIIVGIRSISPNSTSSASAEELPPFIDALANLPNPLPSDTWADHNHDSIDSILRPAQNSTSFRHRRRASMGAFGMGRGRIHDRMDDQRDHRSPDRRRERPNSMSSTSSMVEPRPPPATPASPSPELSRISSRSSTPSHSRPTSLIASGVRDFAAEVRLNNMIARSSPGASPLSVHTEEAASIHSMQSSDHLLPSQADPVPSRLASHRRSDTAPNVHYPRFASGHPRRNGVVEPDHLPPLSRTASSNAMESSSDNVDWAASESRGGYADSRSWIIYVLGGSYPEDHPILTTPSLFTDNPTYEDMMLLSALLGPAKAPVASDEEVESAGGLYEIERVAYTPDAATMTADAAKTAQLVAVAFEGTERIIIDVDLKCLVCLSNFEPGEFARQLIRCKHFFHKDCIDQWLTQGRNSCPLCRSQGVGETESEPERSTRMRESWMDSYGEAANDPL